MAWAPLLNLSDGSQMVKPVARLSEAGRLTWELSKLAH